MGRVVRVLAVLLAVPAIAPAGAAAQGNDPSANSPSGTIYEIPLDSARNDAAPRPSDAEAAQAGQPADQSSIHSTDNGFGSSAVVPGAPASSSGSSAAKRAARKRSASKQKSPISAPAATTNGETLIHPAAQASAPSSTRAYVLLALAAGVALALGAGARLAARRK